MIIVGLGAHPERVTVWSVECIVSAQGAATGLGYEVRCRRLADHSEYA